MGDVVLLLVGALLLLLNAFFVGAEFAVISARRSAIEPVAHEGSSRAKAVIGAMEQVSLMLATCQLGITLASLGLGAVAEPALAHLLEAPFAAVGVPEQLLHPIAFALALLIVVYLHVVLGEMIPKNIALAGPDRAALWLVPPLVACTAVLKPFVVALNWLANGVLRLLRVQPKDEVASAFTRAQVRAMVEEAAEVGLFDEQESALLSGALSFDEERVEAALIPLSGVRSVRLRHTRGEIEAIAAQAGYSRLPVLAEGGAPAFAGYVHVKDVIAADPSGLDAPLGPEAVRPLPTVPAGSPLREVLEAMQRDQVQIAQVRRLAPGTRSEQGDGPLGAESGELIGIVTLEDVLGRLVGHIAAERG